MAQHLGMSATPAHRLPTEIILDIFQRIQPLAPAGRGDPFEDAIAVSHVCRRWRAVALQCREIWATLPVKLGSKWVKAALERSRCSPLSLDISSLINHPFQSLTASEWLGICLALAELPKIKELSIAFLKDIRTEEQFIPGMVEPLKLLCGMPAASLENLEISAMPPQRLPAGLFSGIIPENLQSLEAACVEFDDDVFNVGILPNLRHLKLDECSVRRDHSLLRSHLTSFKVFCCDIWDEDHLDDLVEILSHIPTLDTFNLHGGLSMWMDESATRPRSPQLGRIELPNMKHLLLEEASVANFGLLHRLVLPISATIEICSGGDEFLGRTGIVSTLHRALSSIYDTADAARLSFFHVRIADRDYVRDEFSDTFNRGGYGLLASEAWIPHPGSDAKFNAEQSYKPRQLGDFKLSLIAFDTPEDHPFLPLYQMLFTLPTFQNLHTIYIDHDVLFSLSQNWRLVFGALQSVVDLAVKGDAAYGLANVFSDSEAPQLFPRLKCLHLYYVDFLSAHRTGSDLPSFIALQTGLLARASDASLAPLRLLHIFKGGIARNVVGVLEKLFGDLFQVQVDSSDPE